MFKNIGKKIQHLEIFVFVVELIAIWAAVIILCLTGSDILTQYLGASVAQMSIVILIVAGILLTILCWISHFIGIAYGKIAECCEEECELLRELVKKEIVVDVKMPEYSSAAADSLPKERRCPHCDRLLADDEKFCPECGTRYDD